MELDEVYTYTRPPPFGPRGETHAFAGEGVVGPNSGHFWRRDKHSGIVLSEHIIPLLYIPSTLLSLYGCELCQNCQSDQLTTLEEGWDCVGWDSESTDE